MLLIGFWLKLVFFTPVKNEPSNTEKLFVFINLNQYLWLNFFLNHLAYIMDLVLLEFVIQWIIFCVTLIATVFVVSIHLVVVILLHSGHKCIYIVCLCVCLLYRRYNSVKKSILLSWLLVWLLTSGQPSATDVYNINIAMTSPAYFNPIITHWIILVKPQHIQPIRFIELITGHQHPMKILRLLNPTHRLLLVLFGRFRTLLRVSS